MRPQKRICVVVHSTVPGGGVQEQRINFINHWLKKGYAVDVICPRRGESEIYEYKKKGVIYLSHDTANKNHYSVFKEMVKIFKQKRRSYDRVLANNIFLSFLVAMSLIVARNKSSLYVSIHNPVWYSWGIKYRLRSIVAVSALYFLAFRAKRFSCVSNEIATQLCSFLVLIKKDKSVVVINNPVLLKTVNDDDKLHSTEYVSRLPDKFVLFIGRLHYQKGLDLLLESFKKVKNNATLVVLGDGPEKRDYQKRCDALGITDRVLFCGFHNYTEPFFRKAGCFVLPSRWEGFPNALMEALYFQVPSIAFDCKTGPREILRDGEHGFLVDQGDIDTFLLKIEDALRMEHWPNERWRDYMLEDICNSYLEFMDLSSSPK